MSTGTRTAAVEVLAGSAAEVDEFAESVSFIERAFAAMSRYRNCLVRSAPDIGVPVRATQPLLSDDSRVLYFLLALACAEVDILIFYFIFTRIGYF